jgi:FdhD protein
MLKVEIVRIDVSNQEARKMTDYVAQEKPFYVFLNRTHYATIYCSPSNLKELAVGHVLSEGIVETIEEIQEINLDAEKGVCHVKLMPQVNLEKRLKLAKHFSRVILSACGTKAPYQPSRRLAKIRSNLKVKPEVILNSINSLNFIAKIFRKTGGVHVAAIYKVDGTLVAFAEDVGRHNAVDKVIGITSQNKILLGNCFLVLSGRLTGDIVFKAARVGLPLVASLAAAIDSGITIAKDVNLTLIGFVRGKRMNVYTSPERILQKEGTNRC